MTAFISIGLVIVCWGQSVLVLFASLVDIVDVDSGAATGSMRDKRFSCLWLPIIAICMHYACMIYVFQHGHTLYK